ncbi:MAG: class I tRNA ligase family protein, partial [Phycisphaerales bacterium]|nr:class I tRNA ligase family protein [Phycisphaerales bacterium]
MFQPLPPNFSFPEQEKRILAFWDQNAIFEKSLERRKDAPRFVFYEGPPTANGMPHPGHALTRAMKDIFPRYQTMCGRLVERKAGWDTHGLPVEREVCRELGLKTKQDIEAYGVEKFNLKCIQSVFRYTREWEELTRRVGFWVNLNDAYVTYHQSYVESVWWSLKTLFERKDEQGRPLLYQRHKVVWWWAQGGTALSAGEVGEGYKDVDDPSVFVKFPLNEGGAFPANTSLLVWTTTPWTLISNQYAAVNAELEYALVEDAGPEGGGAGYPEYLIVAAELVEQIAKKVKRQLKVARRVLGKDLVDTRYFPPYRETAYDYKGEIRLGTNLRVAPTPSPTGEETWRYDGTLGDLTMPLVDSAKVELDSYGREKLRQSISSSSSEFLYVGWVTVDASFVTIDSGTGIVHLAPAFGEADNDVWQQQLLKLYGGPVFLCFVNPDGSFNSRSPAHYRGRWVKDCDKDIVRELRDERKTPWGTPLLFHQETYRHPYPFCPQAPDDPLIQYPRTSWFVRTSE